MDRLISWCSLLTAFACLVPVAVGDGSVSTVALPGGSSAVGAFTMASVYGQSTTLARASSGANTSEPGYLCIEAADLGILGDLNNDVHRNFSNSSGRMSTGRRNCLR